MRVVHFNKVDNIGGAAKVAMRVHRYINGHVKGVDSTYVVQKKTVKDPKVVVLNGANRYLEDLIIRKFITPCRTSLTNSLFTFSCVGEKGVGELFFGADVVAHIHWVENFLSLKNIYEIAGQGVPILITLHDEKPYTGGCHCTFGCEMFQYDCSGCIQLIEKSHKLVESVMRDKVDFFLSRKNIHLIAPSRWIKGQAQRSAVFRGAEIEVIPHGVDTRIYNDRNRLAAKNKLGIDQDVTVVLFTANNCSATHKGFAHFLDMLRYCWLDERFSELCDKGKLLLLIAGENVAIEDVGIPVRLLGYVEDECEMRDVYQASDILVNPTLADSFSLVSLEAMACGCVVAGFRTGGLVDFVTGETGRLVAQKDSKALAQAVIDLVVDKALRIKLGNAGVAEVERAYTLERQVCRYIECYSRLLENRASAAAQAASRVGGEVEAFISCNTELGKEYISAFVHETTMRILDAIPFSGYLKRCVRNTFFRRS